MKKQIDRRKGKFKISFLSPVSGKRIVSKKTWKTKRKVLEDIKSARRNEKRLNLKPLKRRIRKA